MSSVDITDNAAASLPNSPEQSLTSSSRSPLRLLLELACLLLVIAGALHSSNRSIGGGDTWVAMANGRYTMGPWAQDDPGRSIQMKLLDVFGIHMTQQDYMGAKTRDYVPGDHDQFGWVNQNWLTHVQFYNMRKWWGENSIVIFKFLQAIATALLAYWTARLLGANLVWAAAAVTFGMLLSRSFIDLRPNQSTIFYAAAMMTVLAYWRKSSNPRVMLWLIPVMILWANVHGGFIYAIMIFVAATSAYALHHFCKRVSIVFVFLGFLVSAYLLLNGATIPEDELGRLAQRYTPWRVFAWLSLLAFAVITVVMIIRLKYITADDFQPVSKKHLYWVIAGMLMTIIIPALFSPFGIENVLHPLVVAAGQEGKIWRAVVEWRPIWDPDGFGNEKPYTWFLIMFAAIAFCWWILLLLRPSNTLTRKQNQPTRPDDLHWPQIDLAMIAVIAITLIMSIKSRRFIFLGGVILAPFLAVLASDAIRMVRILLRHLKGQSITLPAPSQRMTAITFVVVMTAALTVTGVFAAAMNDIYYKPAYDGADLSVFRRMVGIPAQPVDAIQFFDLNNVEGIVLNEWVNGGFITFFQTPQPDTGQALCKVHMDGRAQAAYNLDHFQRWNLIKSVQLPRGDNNARRHIMQMAQQLKLDPQSSSFYHDLVQQALRRADLRAQLEQLATGDPKLYQQLLRLKCRSIMTDWGIHPDADDAYEQFVQRGYRGFTETEDPDKQKDRYQMVAGLAVSDPRLYDTMLAAEGINVVLLNEKKPASQTAVELLLSLPNWRLFYLDDRNIILIRNDGKHNQHLWNNPYAAQYHDDNIAKISQGYMKCLDVDPVTSKQGLELLMSAEYDLYVPRMYDQIFSTGLRLGEIAAIQNYFLTQHNEVKELVDNNVRFGLQNSYVRLLHTTMVLERLATLQKDRAKVNYYHQLYQDYAQKQQDFMQSAREGWLW